MHMKQYVVINLIQTASVCSSEMGQFVQVVVCGKDARRYRLRRTKRCHGNTFQARTDIYMAKVKAEKRCFPHPTDRIKAVLR